jgi:uncharacterized NAD(P)/FAD-binding protein YdhS
VESMGRAGSVDVAIVGGGFSGTMVAVQLARLAGASPLRVAILEKGERFARGVAYGTRSDRHLLNVPAGLMSALPDEPTHFLDWLRARDPAAHEGTFAPRRLYGDYLDDLLRAARSGSSVRIDLVGSEAVSMHPAGDPGPFRIATRDGATIAADRVVLALGHQEPQRLAGWRVDPGPDAYVSNPWSSWAFRGLGRDESVALIGTGLTAVDLVVEARAGGHRGAIYAISRHGLLPSRHPSSPAPPRPHFSMAPAGAAPTARGLVRRLRADAEAWQADGGDWQSVVDSVRPVAQSLWGSLGDRERRRFLRHVASRWDVHRHRLAPAIDDAIQDSRRSGQFEVIAARVRGFCHENGGVTVCLQRRGCDESETLRVRRVINCTGPGRDIRACTSPLLRSILDGGIGRSGPLALGLEVTGSGALVRADGLPHVNLFAVGPLLKERLWETTAVRELRSQALELARGLLASSTGSHQST